MLCQNIFEILNVRHSKIIPIKVSVFVSVMSQWRIHHKQVNMFNVAIRHHFHVVTNDVLFHLTQSGGNTSETSVPNAQLWVLSICMQLLTGTVPKVLTNSSIKTRFMNQGENVFRGYRPVSNINFWF